MPLARLLGTLRYLPGRLLGKGAPPASANEPFLEILFNSGTVILEETPGREIVMGSAGKYHQVKDQQAIQFETRDQFVAFSDPEFQKLVMSLRVDQAGPPGLNRLVLEHWTQALSPESAKRFRRYWLVIKPMGAFVSKQLLKAIARRAEKAAE
jgi:hypothetical protein